MTKRRQVMFAMLIAAAPAWGIDITTCNTTIPAGETGVLQVDLDCAPTSVPAVQVLTKAVLDLNGHSLRGGPTAPTVLGAKDATGAGPANFTIVGPGEIAGTAPDPGPIGFAGGCVDVNDGRVRLTSVSGTIDVHGCVNGIFGGDGTDQIGGRGRVKMDHVTAHDNWRSAVVARTITAEGVEAYNHATGVALSAQRVRVTNVYVHHNNVGIGAVSIRGRDVVASDNIGPDPNSAGGNAIFSSGSIVLTNLVAMNNTNPGISGVRVKLIDSTVTNNGLRPPHFMVDIETERRPVLVNSVCLHSEVSPTGGDWDVCVDD
jgi:hypothetical protein